MGSLGWILSVTVLSNTSAMRAVTSPLGARKRQSIRFYPPKSTPNSRPAGPPSPTFRGTPSDVASGRCTTRGLRSPGKPWWRTRVYLAQHDFVHVLADYGTNLKGELEVFAFIGRADPTQRASRGWRR